MRLSSRRDRGPTEAEHQEAEQAVRQAVTFAEAVGQYCYVCSCAGLVELWEKDPASSLSESEEDRLGIYDRRMLGRCLCGHSKHLHAPVVGGRMRQPVLRLGTSPPVFTRWVFVAVPVAMAILILPGELPFVFRATCAAIAVCTTSPLAITAVWLTLRVLMWTMAASVLALLVYVLGGAFHLW